ncbi:MAG: ABC transporter substrate-binding protein [Candidatus Hodarchaeota archaeon]
MRVRCVLVIIIMISLSMGQIGVTRESIAADKPPDYFQITLIAPTNNPIRVQHAQMITQELWQIGIDADLVLLGLDPVIARLFNSVNFETFEGDGFDIGFIGWTAGNPLNPSAISSFYHSNQIDKENGGNNYYPINHSEVDALADLIDSELDFNTRRGYVRDALQIITWEVHPVMGLYQPANPFAIDAQLRGFDAFRWGQPNPHVPELYYSDAQTVFKFAVKTPFANLNPVFSNSYSDSYFHQPTQAWTYQRDSAMLLRPVLAAGDPIPIGSDDALASTIDIATISPDSPYAGSDGSTTWGPNPNVDAANYNPIKTAANFSMFLVNLREDIPWHPGWGYSLGMFNVTVEDFQWTLGYWMNEELASPRAQAFEDIYGPNPALAIEKINDTMMKINLRGCLASGQVADWYDALSLRPLPSHVLDPTFDATAYGGAGGVGITPDGTTIAAYSDQRWYEFNTGEKPIIGVGAYYFDKWDGTNLNATLRKFGDWGGYGVSSLWNTPMYSQNNIDTYTVVVYPAKDSAELDLENEVIDGIDAQFQMGPDIDYLQTKPNIQVLLVEGGGIETMGYNTYHPKLSNRYVRLAISHMVPAQKLVDSLLGGLGSINELVGIALPNPYAPSEEDWETLGLTTSENVVDPLSGEELKFQGHIRYNLAKAWALMEKAGYNMDPFRAYVLGDTTAPSISSPSDITYEVGETGNQIVWEVSDAYPEKYNITRNETLVDSDFWDNGTISYGVDDLAVGIYLFRLTIWDYFGNSTYNEVIVTVIEKSEPPSSEPPSSEPPSSEPPSSEPPPSDTHDPTASAQGFQLLLALLVLAAFSLISNRHRR